MSKFSIRFLVMAVTFTVCLITSNFFVPRLWQVGHTGFQLSGAVLLFPVSYILNDCLTEVYGYRKSRLVIWLAFALSAFVAVMSQIVCCLPAPAGALQLTVRNGSENHHSVPFGIHLRLNLQRMDNEQDESPQQRQIFWAQSHSLINRRRIAGLPYLLPVCVLGNNGSANHPQACLHTGSGQDFLRTHHPAGDIMVRQIHQEEGRDRYL